MLHAEHNLRSMCANERGILLVQGDMMVCLPGQPPVRREIMRVAGESRTFTLCPDASGAGTTLRMAEDHFHATLAGPEQAEIEVYWLVRNPNGVTVPLWALARGRDVEASLWDGFGTLLVPDVLARGLDAPDVILTPGRYQLTAIVAGHASLVIGAGCSSVDALGLRASKRSVG